MKAYVEHANVTVKNIDHTIDFLSTALPEFKVRHRGQSDYRWCHIGTEKSYIALQEVQARHHVERTPYVDVGMNHIGLVVEDVDAIEQRLLNAGYEKNEMGESHPYRRRIYFFDDSGGEWEFVQYLSKEDSKRNQYDTQ